jgi:hypothetical protein
MARFITRIELHKAIWPDDYNELHKQMKKEGFTNEISGSDGITYALPTAEYYKEGEFTLAAILESAKKAANTIGKNYGVISSLAPSSTWSGLEPIKK